MSKLLDVSIDQLAVEGKVLITLHLSTAWGGGLNLKLSLKQHIVCIGSRNGLLQNEKLILLRSKTKNKYMQHAKDAKMIKIFSCYKTLKIVYFF